MASKKKATKTTACSAPACPLLVLGFDGAHNKVVVVEEDSAPVSAVFKKGVARIANALYAQGRGLPDVHALVCQHVLLASLMGHVEQYAVTGVWRCLHPLQVSFNVKDLPDAPVKSKIKGKSGLITWDNSAEVVWGGADFAYPKSPMVFIDGSPMSGVGTINSKTKTPNEDTLSSDVHAALSYSMGANIGKPTAKDKGTLNFTFKSAGLEALLGAVLSDKKLKK